MDSLAFATLMGDLARADDPFAVATIVRTFGSTLGKPGFRILVSKEGEVLHGSLGGACPEGPIVSAAVEAMAEGRPRLVRVHLEGLESSIQASIERVEDEVHLETECGGGMDIYIEPYVQAERLVILGHGGRDELEDRLVALGKMLDFRVVVVDHSPALSTEPDELHDELDFDLGAFEWRPTDTVVILSRTERSTGMLEDLSGSGVRYVGLLASRKRAQRSLDALRRKGVTEEYLETIRTPVGMDIGAIGPGEIALSIMADVVAARRGKRLSGNRSAVGARLKEGE